MYRIHRSILACVVDSVIALRKAEAFSFLNLIPTRSASRVSRCHDPFDDIVLVPVSGSKSNSARRRSTTFSSSIPLAV
jgi:hypothetical protein